MATPHKFENNTKAANDATWYRRWDRWSIYGMLILLPCLFVFADPSPAAVLFVLVIALIRLYR